MNTLQINNFYKLADANSDAQDTRKVIRDTLLDTINTAEDKQFNDFLLNNALGGGLIGGLGGGLTTLFNSPENRTWSNALKRALVGMAIGGGLGGGTGYIKFKANEPLWDKYRNWVHATYEGKPNDGAFKF